VALHYRSRPEAAKSLIDGLSGEHLAVGADLTEPAELEEAVARVERELGPVAVLVNAAHPGNHPLGPVAGGDPAVLRAQLEAVTVHAALCSRVVPGMRAAGRGRVVYLSGALMSRPAPGFGAYAAAKSAATALTKYLALEEGQNGITANIVAPGRVVDPDEEADLTPEQAELSAQLLERMALPRFPSPADVAASVLTLVESPAITGQVLWVTGGEPING
jgi:NAD(P)-dependent dehydrogenase (short-subunit alcohol dehydrogenase family)